MLLTTENRFGTQLEFFRSSHSVYSEFGSAGNSEFSGKLQRRIGFGVTGDTKLGGAGVVREPTFYLKCFCPKGLSKG